MRIVGVTISSNGGRKTKADFNWVENTNFFSRSLSVIILSLKMRVSSKELFSSLKNSWNHSTKKLSWRAIDTPLIWRFQRASRGRETILVHHRPSQKKKRKASILDGRKLLSRCYIAQNARHFTASLVRLSRLLSSRISISKKTHRDPLGAQAQGGSESIDWCRCLLSYFLVKFLLTVFFPFVSVAPANFLHVGSVMSFQCSNVLFDVIVSAWVSGSERKYVNLTTDKSCPLAERREPWTRWSAALSHWPCG